MPLLYYPNPSLSVKCIPILEFDESIAKLFDELKETLSKHKGWGLSANQIGSDKRAIVIKTAKDEVYEMANPMVLETNGAVRLQEGCLSFPEIFLDVTRPASILLQYQDRTGEVKKVIAEGIEARTIVHEIEHLLGRTFLSHANRQQRLIVKSKAKKFPK